jgi:uncharacterized lipoprotein
MKTMLTRIIIVLYVVSLAACTSLRTVTDRGAAQFHSQSTLNQIVFPNDAVVVITTDDKQFALRVTATSANALDGISDQSAAPLHFEISQIKRIERREIDGMKTALLVVAIALGVYVVVAGAASAAGATIAAGV